MADDPHSPAAQQQVTRLVYYRNPPKGQTGEQRMYTVDAHQAVAKHPDEWSFQPWGDSAEGKEAHPYAAVEIPGDWRDLPTARRRGIAMSLGAPNTVKAGEADDGIQAEVERREQLQAEYAKRVENVENVQNKVVEQDRVAIPENWRDLSKGERVAIAKRLGAPATAEPDQFIQMEVTRRAAPPSPSPAPRPPTPGNV